MIVKIPANDMVKVKLPYEITKYMLTSSECCFTLVFAIASYMLYFLSALVANLLCMNNIGKNDDTYFGLLSSYISQGRLCYMIFLMPLFVICAIGMLELMLIFLKNEIIGIIIIFSYIVASAYCNNPLLIGNYIMIRRYNFSNLLMNFVIDTIICLSVIIISIVAGYLNFRKIEWGNHKCI